MTKPREWTKGEEREIKAAIKKGIPMPQIAKDFETSRFVITRLKKKLFTPLEIEQMKTLFTRGLIDVDEDIKKLIIDMLKLDKYSFKYIGRTTGTRCEVVQRINREVNGKRDK